MLTEMTRRPYLTISTRHGTGNANSLSDFPYCRDNSTDSAKNCCDKQPNSSSSSSTRPGRLQPPPGALSTPGFTRSTGCSGSCACCCGRFQRQAGSCAPRLPGTSSSVGFSRFTCDATAPSSRRRSGTSPATREYRQIVMNERTRGRIILLFIMCINTLLSFETV